MPLSASARAPTSSSQKPACGHRLGVEELVAGAAGAVQVPTALATRRSLIRKISSAKPPATATAIAAGREPAKMATITAHDREDGEHDQRVSMAVAPPRGAERLAAAAGRTRRSSSARRRTGTPRRRCRRTAAGARARSAITAPRTPSRRGRPDAAPLEVPRPASAARRARRRGDRAARAGAERRRQQRARRRSDHRPRRSCSQKPSSSAGLRALVRDRGAPLVEALRRVDRGG